MNGYQQETLEVQGRNYSFGQPPIRAMSKKQSVATAKGFAITHDEQQMRQRLATEAALPRQLSSILAINPQKVNSEGTGPFQQMVEKENNKAKMKNSDHHGSQSALNYNRVPIKQYSKDQRSGGLKTPNMMEEQRRSRIVRNQPIKNEQQYKRDTPSNQTGATRKLQASESQGQLPGLRDSVFNFFKLDQVFKEVNKPTNKQVGKPKPSTIVGKPQNPSKHIFSSQQIEQKTQYHSNLHDQENEDMSEALLETMQLIRSPDFKGLQSQAAKDSLSMRNQSQRYSRQSSIPANHAQPLSTCRANNVGIVTQSSAQPQHFTFQKNAPKTRQSDSYSKQSEITTINVVNPLNSNQQKTLFAARQGRQRPSMQIDFEGNQQQKKEDNQETVGQNPSSEEEDAYVARAPLRVALDRRGGGAKKAVVTQGVLNEQKTAGRQRPSPSGMRTQQHFANQREENLQNARCVSQRSKLEKLRKIDGNQASESEEHIVMSEEEQEEQQRAIIEMTSPQLGQIKHAQEASESKKIRIYSELSSPLRQKSKRQMRAEDDKTEELREEYLRLQQELEFLKGNQSLSSARQESKVGPLADRAARLERSQGEARADGRNRSREDSQTHLRQKRKGRQDLFKKNDQTTDLQTKKQKDLNLGETALVDAVEQDEFQSYVNKTASGAEEEDQIQTACMKAANLKQFGGVGRSKSQSKQEMVAHFQDRVNVVDAPGSGFQDRAKKTKHHQRIPSRHTQGHKAKKRHTSAAVDVRQDASQPPEQLKKLRHNDTMYDAHNLVQQLGQKDHSLSYNMLSPTSILVGGGLRGPTLRPSQKQTTAARNQNEKKVRGVKEQNGEKNQWHRLKKSFLSDNEKEELHHNSKSYSASQSNNSEDLQISDISGITDAEQNFCKSQETRKQARQKRQANKTPKITSQSHRAPTAKTRKHEQRQFAEPVIETSQMTPNNEVENQKRFYEYQNQIQTLQSQMIDMQNRTLLTSVQQSQPPYNQASMLNQSLQYPVQNLSTNLAVRPLSSTFGMPGLPSQMNDFHQQQQVAQLQYQYENQITLLQTQLKGQQLQLHLFQQEHDAYTNVDQTINDILKTTEKASKYENVNDVSKLEMEALASEKWPHQSSASMKPPLTPREMRRPALERSPGYEEDMSGLHRQHTLAASDGMFDKRSLSKFDVDQEMESLLLADRREKSLMRFNDEEMKDDFMVPERDIPMRNTPKEAAEAHHNRGDSKHSVLWPTQQKSIDSVQGGARRSLKHTLKATAGFPSMLDSGIQGTSIPFPSRAAHKGRLQNPAGAEFSLDEAPERMVDDVENSTKVMPSASVHINDKDFDTMTNPDIQSSQMIATARDHRTGSQTAEVSDTDLPFRQGTRDGQLLIIGFEDKPKGRNPLRKHRSPPQEKQVYSPRILISKGKNNDPSRTFEIDSGQPVVEEMESVQIIQRQARPQGQSKNLYQTTIERSAEFGEQHGYLFQKKTAGLGASANGDQVGARELERSKEKAQSQVALRALEFEKGRSERAEVMSSPSKRIEQPKQAINYDKSDLLIQDDMPNLQEVFRKKRSKQTQSRRSGQSVTPSQNLLSSKGVQGKASGARRGGTPTSGSPRRPGELYAAASQKSIDNTLTASMANYDEDSYLDNTSTNMPQRGSGRQTRKVKTKTELAALRREMMKTKFKGPGSQQRPTLDNASMSNPSQMASQVQIDLTSVSNMDAASLSGGPGLKAEGAHRKLLQNPTSAGARVSTQATPSGTKPWPPKGPETASDVKLRDGILSRLASGQKVSVDKKAMKRLTSKNYEKLPEIRKKKEEAKKQEELVAKKQRAAAYQKELGQRLRQNLLKKKEKQKKSAEIQAEHDTTLDRSSMYTSHQARGEEPIQIIQSIPRKTFVDLE